MDKHESESNAEKKMTQTMQEQVAASSVVAIKHNASFITRYKRSVKRIFSKFSRGWVIACARARFYISKVNEFYL